MYLGIANADLTAAQIEECLETSGPLGPADRDKAEEAERFCKIVGEFVTRTGASDTVLALVGPEGGAPVSKTIRWTFIEDIGWNWFIYRNAAAAMTTGATVRLLATNYGVWVT